MEVRRGEIGGLPVFWAESDLPFSASILVRMGRVDETMLTSGMSHLLARLVLAGESTGDVDATVMPLRTQFRFAGDRSRALGYLGDTLAAMRNPPLGRRARVRRILLDEDDGRAESHLQTHAGLRFGARALGLLDVPEYGLYRVTRDRVSAWALRFFTQGNVVLTMTGAPPDGVDWSLP